LAIALNEREVLKKAMGGVYLLMKLIIYINLTTKIMDQKQLKFYYKLWKINEMI
jgi:hypothetical protein